MSWQSSVALYLIQSFNSNLEIKPSFCIPLLVKNPELNVFSSPTVDYLSDNAPQDAYLLIVMIRKIQLSATLL